MKYAIALCDDERAQTEYLRGVALCWAAERGHIAVIAAYDSAETFLFDWEETPSCDILLLDIQMGGLSGMDLARKMRAADKRTQIVFITAFPDFAAEGYDVDAAHYLTKPVDEEKLFQVLDKAAERLAASERALLLPTEVGTARVPVGEIMLVESFAHVQEITTIRGAFSVKMPVYALEKQLGGGFVRCHRSYVVGLKHIKRITKTNIELDNGRVVPLSRRLYSQVNKALIDYVTGEDRR